MNSVKVETLSRRDHNRWPCLIPSNKTCRLGEHQVRLLVVYPHLLLSKTLILGEWTINILILIRRYCTYAFSKFDAGCFRNRELVVHGLTILEKVKGTSLLDGRLTVRNSRNWRCLLANRQRKQRAYQIIVPSGYFYPGKSASRTQARGQTTLRHI
jgi:hypothetical protein